ncbi:hypothetical protein LTR56_003328 [Elasticomyces elasticus]|nr:hypothetical protein LTR56_003328 [Elasticomyces elasticus]KAK3664254.1 hypothetical protein LTR22_004952 [Elasticomyces elasticus]KAK4931470.1 hypothetical protein LTR49_002171 [Elasticomyces elasticus]KAK5766011.1 hypothetical protein LTS12_003757 [Elasticomyces elasticus]
MAVDELHGLVGESTEANAEGVDLSHQLAALDLTAGGPSQSTTPSSPGGGDVVDAQAVKESDEETKLPAETKVEKATVSEAEKETKEAAQKLARAKAKNKAVTNIIRYFDKTYGRDEDKLEIWQLLCVHVGIEPELSIMRCKMMLKRVFINIYDFVDAQEGGAPFVRFPTTVALSDYTWDWDKLFPLKRAKNQPVLKWMLIKLHPRPEFRSH